MGKKLIVGSVFAAVAIFASYAVSQDQFRGTGSLRAARASHNDEGREPAADFAQIVNHFKAELGRRIAVMPEPLPKDIELMKALDKYLADDKLEAIIRQLEELKATFPETNEANKAEGAIQILKGGRTDTSIPTSPLTGRDSATKASLNTYPRGRITTQTE